MGSLTAATPKPLLAVSGRPLIEHILQGIAATGIRRVIVVTGYLGEQIESALGTGARLGLELSYCRQARMEGTARSLLLVEPMVGDEPFLLSWGDIIVSGAFYRKFVEAFRAAPCDAQLAVNEVDDPWRGAAVYVDASRRVTKLEEKPARGTSTTRWNNAGISVLTRRVFDHARRLGRSSRGEYELPQAVSEMVKGGDLVRAYPIRGLWLDVGTPRDLEAAQKHLPLLAGVESSLRPTTEAVFAAHAGDRARRE